MESFQDELDGNFEDPFSTASIAQKFMVMLSTKPEQSYEKLTVAVSHTSEALELQYLLDYKEMCLLLNPNGSLLISPS